MDTQIITNSEIDGDLSFPLLSLNFKQIEKILQLINEVGFSNSKNTHEEYSILLLKPGDYTYTGGTGEVYAYELFDGSGYGKHSPEDCLETVMLRLIDELGIKGLDRKEEFSALFDYLQNFEKNNSSGNNAQIKDDSNHEKNSAIFHGQGWNSKSGESIEPVIQPGLSIGSMVMHNKFGRGKVLIVEGIGEGERVQVEFKSAGIKWLAVAMAKLTVLE